MKIKIIKKSNNKCVIQEQCIEESNKFTEIYYTVNGKRGNKIRIYKDYAELIVTYNGEDIAYKIDIADISIVIQHKWGFHLQGENCVRKDERGPNLEGTLFNVYGKRFEYINGDIYDCRRANLRIKGE